MRLAERANQLATAVLEAINNDDSEVSVTAITSRKGIKKYGRILPDGAIVLRVYVTTPLSVYHDLGTMELFIPVSKQQLKQNCEAVFASVLRTIGQTATNRQAMIARAKEQLTA